MKKKQTIEARHKKSIFKQYFSIVNALSFSPDDEKMRFFVKQERILFEIDSFVDLVCSASELPFQINFTPTNQTTINNLGTNLNKYLCQLPDFIDVIETLSPQLDYSEGIHAFIAALNSTRLTGFRDQWSANGENRIYSVNENTATFSNYLVEEIRVVWRSRKATLKVGNKIADAKDCYRDYCSYVDYLFKIAECPIVLIFQLYYQSSCSDSVTINRAIEDFNHLIKNKRSNSAFYLMTGYVAKLSFYPDVGFSWSVVFFYDAEKKTHSSGIHLVETVGNIWLFITNGEGNYHFDEFFTSKYAELLPYQHKKTLNHLIDTQTLKYFCFVDIFFRPNANRKVKLLRRGNYKRKNI